MKVEELGAFINQYLPGPSGMLFPGRNLTSGDTVVDLSGGKAQQTSSFRDRNALTVSLIRSGNTMFITDPSDSGIGKFFPFRSSQPGLV